MRRQEAEKLIGKKVLAWTGLNGTYIGDLVRLTDSRPWRGEVRILAVSDYPTHGVSLMGGWKKRTPFREGEVRDFGNASIRLYEGDVPTYADSVRMALDRDLAKFREYLDRAQRVEAYQKDLWWLEKTVQGLAEQRAALDAPSDQTTTMPDTRENESDAEIAAHS